MIPPSAIGAPSGEVMVAQAAPEADQTRASRERTDVPEETPHGACADLLADGLSEDRGHTFPLTGGKRKWCAKDEYIDHF